MADTKSTVTVLEKVPLFQSLKKGQLERLAKRFVEREFAAGKNIVTQGQGGEGFFIIVSGKVDVVRERSDGAKVLVNQFAGGDYFGELALLDEGIRTASVVAKEPVKCLALTRWDFLAVLRDDAEMAVDILQEMARRFRVALDAL